MKRERKRVGGAPAHKVRSRLALAQAMHDGGTQGDKQRGAVAARRQAALAWRLTFA